MKKIVSLVLCVCLLACAFCGCTGKSKPVIGIIQFGSHESLNNCYDGIIAGLGETLDLSQYDVQHLNSNFTAETSLAQATKLVNSKAKVIIAIATPSAIQAATAASGSDVPVVYCAVTDATQVANFKNLTGTSDIPDFSAQLSLVTAFMGRTDLKIGVMMSTEESSDTAQLASLTQCATAYNGMSIVSEVVSDITTIDAKTDALIAKDIDCMVNLLDNTIVGKLQNILVKTDAAGIPVFGSEIEQVKAGCVASASIDYVTVGTLSGRQAARIVAGESAQQVAPQTMENETYPFYSSKAMQKFPALKLPNLVGLTDVDAQ